jgi:ferrous-iron efflux pump FieF
MQKSNTASRHARLLRLATHASVATATLLIAAKLAAWALTGSVSVLASLIDSMMDVAASLINLFAVRYALTPADHEHRFGHGKAESLAGLAQTTFIAGSAVFLILQALDRLLHPRPLEDIGIGVGVMVFAILATLALLLLQRHVVRATGSTAIRADALHYTTDVLTNASIILALLLSGWGWHGIDALFGLGIAAYILHSAWRIGHEAFQLLMDRELPDEQRQRIRQTALSHAEVRGVHDLRTRRAGHDIFIQMHLELDDNLSLLEAHGIADQVEALIRNIHPEADILIHTDPHSLEENVAFR